MKSIFYGINIIITDRDGIRLGVAKLFDEHGDVLKVEERAYLNKNASDATIIESMTSAVGSNIPKWRNDYEEYTTVDSVTPYDKDYLQGAKHMQAFYDCIQDIFKNKEVTDNEK